MQVLLIISGNNRITLWKDISNLEWYFKPLNGSKDMAVYSNGSPCDDFFLNVVAGAVEHTPLSLYN